MKKIVTLLLAAILALGCTACGSSGSAAPCSRTVTPEPLAIS